MFEARRWARWAGGRGVARAVGTAPRGSGISLRPCCSSRCAASAELSPARAASCGRGGEAGVRGAGARGERREREGGKGEQIWGGGADLEGGRWRQATVGLGGLEGLGGLGGWGGWGG